MPDRELFAISKNGIEVTFDPIYSHTATHFKDTPQIRPFVKETIERTNISGEMMEFDTDTGQLLGSSDLVDIDDSDDIIYAIRKNRDRHMIFTKSRQPQPSSMVSISLTRLDDKTYDLYSAWLGPQTPPTPNNPLANSQSKPFWSKHALVWGNQEIQAGTETETCPW
jgi:hypothetical protein